MKTYIYWPNGVLEIRIAARCLYFGHPTKGESLYGKPRPDDKVQRIDTPAYSAGSSR